MPRLYASAYELPMLALSEVVHPPFPPAEACVSFDQRGFKGSPWPTQGRRGTGDGTAELRQDTDRHAGVFVVVCHNSLHVRAFHIE